MAKGFKHGAGGGAGLTFSVKAYASESALPSAERENTIAVFTDEINGWVFSATEPTSPDDKMVWFPTGTSSTVKFNALKKNGIEVYPISAKQYIDGAWVGKTAKSYQDGKWSHWLPERVYIVKDGQAQYEFGKSDGLTVRQDADKVAIYGSGGGHRAAWVDDFDLTGYGKLVLTGSFHPSGNQPEAVLCVWESDVSTPIYSNAIASAYYGTDGNSIPISDLNGKYKVGIATSYINEQNVVQLYIEL